MLESPVRMAFFLFSVVIFLTFHLEFEDEGVVIGIQALSVRTNCVR